MTKPLSVDHTFSLREVARFVSGRLEADVPLQNHLLGRDLTVLECIELRDQCVSELLRQHAERLWPLLTRTMSHTEITSTAWYRNELRRHGPTIQVEPVHSRAAVRRRALVAV